MANFDLKFVNIHVGDISGEIKGIVEFEVSSWLPFGMGLSRILHESGSFQKRNFFVLEMLEEAKREF